MHTRLGLLAVLALSTTVRAEDDPAIRQLTWRVGADGQLLVWPNWRQENNMEHEHSPVGLFPPPATALVNEVAQWFSKDRGAVDIFELVAEHSMPLSAVALFSGPIDLVSMTDADYHYRRLRLGYAVENVSQYGPSDNPSLLRRRKLDFLLWMRIAGRRGHPFSLREETQQDAITRAVAKQVNAGIAGERPLAPRWMPVEIPAECAVYAYVDSRRVPVSTRIMRLVHRAYARQMQSVLDGLGVVLSDFDVVRGQEAIDRLVELPYELARRYGNVMADRIWLAGTWGPEPKGIVRVDGLLEIEHARVALKGAGAASANDGPIDVDFSGVRVRISKRHVELRVGALQDGAPQLVEDLKREGLGGDAAIWAHVRDTSALPWLATAGVQRATLRASFSDGVNVSATGMCRDKAAANAVVRTLMDLRTAATTAILRGKYVNETTREPPTAAARSLAELVRSIDVSAQATTVTVRFAAANETPESLLTVVAEGYPAHLEFE